MTASSTISRDPDRRSASVTIIRDPGAVGAAGEDLDEVEVADVGERLDVDLLEALLLAGAWPRSRGRSRARTGRPRRSGRSTSRP